MASRSSSTSSRVSASSSPTRSCARRGACASRRSSTTGIRCVPGTGSGPMPCSARSSARWSSTCARRACRCPARSRRSTPHATAGLRIAIASSSSRELIDAVVERLGIGDVVDAVCTADDEERGKPDPGVYLSAAQALDVMPSLLRRDRGFAGRRHRGHRRGDALHRAPFGGRAQLATSAMRNVVIDSLLEITPELLLSRS